MRCCWWGRRGEKKYEEREVRENEIHNPHLISCFHFSFNMYSDSFVETQHSRFSLSQSTRSRRRFESQSIARAKEKVVDDYCECELSFSAAHRESRMSRILSRHACMCCADVEMYNVVESDRRERKIKRKAWITEEQIQSWTRRKMFIIFEYFSCVSHPTQSTRRINRESFRAEQSSSWKGKKKEKRRKISIYNIK
jgi:hypothetical protein